jgi:ferredoxin
MSHQKAPIQELHFQYSTFTGTGNSLYVAKQLEKSPVSILRAIHNPDTHYKDETIGIVCPIYGHEMPQMVTEEDREAHRKFLEFSKAMPADVWQSPYQVSEECIGCGICMRVYPSGCIYLEKQRAVHTDKNCQMCMACIHTSPQKAIQLKMPEKNPEARYRNENIGLMELIEANEQKIKLK